MSKTLRIVLLAAGAVVVLAVGVAALGTWLLYRTLTAPPEPSTAEPVPASVELTTVDGRTLTFGDLRGRVVLLDFWATWCGPCRMAIPSLERLDESFAGEPFTLVSVSLDGERQALLDFLEEEGDPEEGTAWPQVWDGERALDERFRITSLPTFVLLDGEGRPVYRSSGWAPFKGSVLGWRVRRHLEALETAAGPRTAGSHPHEPRSPHDPA